MVFVQRGKRVCKAFVYYVNLQRRISRLYQDDISCTRSPQFPMDVHVTLPLRIRLPSRCSSST
jgi:hypothetical protein